MSIKEVYSRLAISDHAVSDSLGRNVDADQLVEESQSKVMIYVRCKIA
jgi:hypothetical protein